MFRVLVYLSSGFGWGDGEGSLWQRDRRKLPTTALPSRLTVVRASGRPWCFRITAPQHRALRQNVFGEYLGRCQMRTCTCFSPRRTSSPTKNRILHDLTFMTSPGTGGINTNTDFGSDPSYAWIMSFAYGGFCFAAEVGPQTRVVLSKRMSREHFAKPPSAGLVVPFPGTGSLTGW